jgi:MFS family permease
MTLGFDMRRIAREGDKAPENSAPAARERVPGGPAESLGGQRTPRKSGVPSLVRALRHPNYRLFFGGQLISLTGTWMQMVAQSWLVYRLTGSAVLLGFVGFSGQLPVFLLAPLGGSVADRLNRRRILVATQTMAMLLAFLLAALTLTGRVQVWHVFVLAALLGITNAFDIPTRQAFVVDMVGKEDLINAIALNSSMINGARIVGPAVAGVLLDALGEGWCFFANGVSFLAVIAGLLLMKMSDAGAIARIAAGEHHRRVSLHQAHTADPCPVAAAGSREPHGDALRRAHADLRRPDPARGRAGTGTADGRHGGWGLGGIHYPGGEERYSRPGPLDRSGRHGVRHQPGAVFFLALLLALGGPASAGWFLHDHRDGLVQHAHSDTGLR